MLRLRIAGEEARQLDAAAWVTQPRSSVKATFKDGVVRSCEGVALFELLRPGTPDGHAKSDRRALASAARVVSGDGYVATFSLAEIDPGIGGGVALLADRCDGAALAPREGPLRLIVPADRRPARWVRDVRTIEVLDLPH